MAGELGDITEFLKDSSVSNLDWLDVPDGPREPLPRQNLDIVPDLEAAWSHTDQPATNFVPNTGDAPRTMGDMSAVHGPLRMAPADIVRTARLAIMQSPTDRQRIANVLKSRYDLDALRTAKTALSEVMAERGLLGGYYVAASDFPTCNRGASQPPAFVRKYASEARFLLAKQACQDCIHRQANRCGVFHKEIVLEVPYTEELADAVESTQAAKGVKLATEKGTPRERIRLALIQEAAPASMEFTGQPQPQPKKANIRTASKDQALATAGQLAKEIEAADKQKLAAIKARPIISMLRREMLKGRSEAELVHSLKLAFDVQDLQATRPLWEPVFKEAGLYGTVYMQQTDFDDCRLGADFVNKHGSKLRAIVAGAKCGSCIFSQAGRCMMYGRKLVASSSEVLTPEVVAAVLDEHKMAGNLPPAALQRSWGGTPSEALKAIYRAASGPKPTVAGDVRGVIERAFHGSGPQQTQTSSVLKQQIVLAAQQYMNEGLYGDDLGKVLRGRFGVQDLMAAKAELKAVIASEQGLQGIKYIDPTVYEDYGHGCHTAARLHRSRAAVRFAKVGSKCASCVHQTMPGVCSVLSKTLVTEPPYVDKAAEQRAILASGKATEVTFASLMNNGLTAMQEYQLQHGDGTINLNPEGFNPQIEVEFGSQEVKLP